MAAPLATIEVRRRRVTAPRAARNARGSWAERDCLLVRLVDDRSVEGWGECSPLPGFSPDDVDACEAELIRLSPQSLDQAPPTSRAARFALETARLDLRGRQQGVAAARLLGAHDDAGLGLAVLLPMPGAPTLVDEAQAAIAAGYRTLKVKLDGARFHDDLRVLRNLRRRLPADARLRLDANGSLDPSRLEAQLAALVELAPEFVEEPAPLEILQSVRSVPVPVALDESLVHEPLAAALLQRRLATVLVLKPALLGGLAAARRWADRARACGAKVVVSHLWEGPVAMAACGAFALSLGAVALDAGLGPHAFLAGWPKGRSAVFAGARLVAPREPGLGVTWEEAP